MSTGFEAGIAEYAFFFSPHNTPLSVRTVRKSAGRTDGNAVSTGGTELYGFWIMAVDTIKVTALEKHRSPVAGTVNYAGAEYTVDRRQYYHSRCLSSFPFQHMGVYGGP
jgi:hypothetical protein